MSKYLYFDNSVLKIGQFHWAYYVWRSYKCLKYSEMTVYDYFNFESIFHNFLQQNLKKKFTIHQLPKTFVRSEMYERISERQQNEKNWNQGLWSLNTVSALNAWKKFNTYIAVDF